VARILSAVLAALRQQDAAPLTSVNDARETA